MSKSTIIAIIEKYCTGTLSAEEEVILNDWLENTSADEFHLTLDQCETLPASLEDFRAIPRDFVHTLETRLNELDDQDKNEEPPIRSFSWKKSMVAAASLILLLSAGTGLWNTDNVKPAIVQAPATINNDVGPGFDGAILTLASGKQIILDSAKNGSLTTEGTTKITKLSNGQLAYNGPDENTAEILYNTLTTPKGRKTSVVLADGTQVWLNAASSIRYPTSFSGGERRIEITGEAYFEIAKNSAMPFVVRKSGGDYRIQVLGTHFNVNAYDDEDVIRTTLLEGSVKILKKGSSSTLKPGQQAIASNGNDRIEVLPDANIGEVMAWKNGIFRFDRADIKTVMRQIARWYDVDVEYKGTITQHFGGTISRDVNVSHVFKMLEMTGAVRFTIEGRKIEVMP